MPTKAVESAFPIPMVDTPHGVMSASAWTATDLGLTKREYFAALALQGLLSNPNCDAMSYEATTQAAVISADELINQLNNQSLG